jgi:hypothetical protein
MICFLLFLLKINCSNYVGSCSNKPDVNSYKISSKASSSCPLPVHLDTTTLNQNAFKASNEALFRMGGGLAVGMGDASTLEASYGGMASGAMQNALRAQGDYNGLSHGEMRRSLGSVSDYNRLASLQMSANLGMNGGYGAHAVAGGAIAAGVRAPFLNASQGAAQMQMQSALSLQEGLNGMTSMEMQNELNKQAFQNDENFENIKHFQNYKEMHAESFASEMRKDQKSATFSKGIEMKFTSLSESSKIENYVKVFSSSKTFTLQTNQNGMTYINLVSTTRYYHPQFRIYEKKDGKFILLQNVNFSNKFFLSMHSTYVMEIGTENSIDTEPYPNMKNGTYQVIMSSEVRNIGETLNEEGIKVQIWGFEGMAPFTHNSELDLFHDSWKYLSFGILNYQITPFYDLARRTITVYYHHGSSQSTGKKPRSTEIEIKCNRNLISHPVFYGTEPRPATYHFDVESKRICDLINLID